MEGNPTLCSIHCATLSSFLSWRTGPRSCKPMGSPRLDRAMGTETAGRPVEKRKIAEGTSISRLVTDQFGESQKPGESLTEYKHKPQRHTGWKLGCFYKIITSAHQSENHWFNSRLLTNRLQEAVWIPVGAPNSDLSAEIKATWFYQKVNRLFYFSDSVEKIFVLSLLKLESKKKIMLTETDFHISKLNHTCFHKYVVMLYLWKWLFLFLHYHCECAYFLLQTKQHN